MFSYIVDNPREYSELLQFLLLFLVFVIGIMIYMMSLKTTKLENEISQLEMECPPCPTNPKCPDHPAHPAIPACPVCPSLTCDNDGKCPDCNCPANDKCPDCPDCSANANCPSLDDIISGIFPGRNPGLTSGGRFFDVKASESYELMPDYDFYDPVNAFPNDNLLSAPGNLLAGNVNVPLNELGNSVDGNLVTTSPDVSLSRMNMSSQGMPTGPSTFGADTTRVSGGLTNVERQRRAAVEDGGDPVEAAAQQQVRDTAETDMREDLNIELDSSNP
jgi:hypothetical protein